MSARGAAIVSDLRRHTLCFDFTQDRLADDVSDAASVGIFIGMDFQTDPDGTAWQPLSEAYAKWKAKKVPGKLMAELEDHMKTVDQIKGFIEIFPGGMAQTYGVDEQAQDEAAWFSEGNARQPSREFYGFTEKAIEMVDEVLDARFKVVV